MFGLITQFVIRLFNEVEEQGRYRLGHLRFGYFDESFGHQQHYGWELRIVWH
jgi:hypothetical protein